MRSGEKLRAALGRSALHLELALLVLGVERVYDVWTASDRVRVASIREQLELTVEDYRTVVRGHRDGPDPSMADV